MNNHSAKILSDLIGITRGLLPQEDATYLVLSLLAWNVMWHKGLLTDNLDLQKFEGLKDTEQVVNAFADLTREWKLHSFDHCSGLVKRLPPEIVSALILNIRHMQIYNMLSEFDPSDVALQLSPNGGPGALDTSLCDLAVELLADVHSKSVYVPWDMSGQLTSRVGKKSASVFSESQQSLSLTELVSIIVNKAIRVDISDPLRHPSYTRGYERLIPFNAALSMPPVGVRVDKDIVQNDTFNRFIEPSNQLATLALQHIIAQADGKIVFITGNSMLFSAGAERQLRERIVQAGMLEAVVSLPSGLMSHAAIPLTILVLDTSKKASAVRFVNAAVPYFYEQANRGKNQLIRTDELISLVNSVEDSPYAKSVSIQEIADNDMQLQVNRYVLDAQTRRLNAFMEQHQFAELGELVEIIKPIAALISEDGEPAFEVLAADVPEFGYIHAASKPVQMDTKSRKAADLKLRQDDIVLMIKGAVGKVGIVGSTNDSYWTVGPSAVILRADAGRIDPRALALFLRSGLGQHLLKGAASGAVQPFIQLKELVTLKIPVSSLSEHMECGAILEQEEDIQTQIRRLNASLSELTPTQWQLSAESSSDHNIN